MIILENKSAYFNYTIEQEFIAGIILKGGELKSILDKSFSIKESFCVIENNEIFLRNLHVDRCSNYRFEDHDEKRDKKLLLNRIEITKLQKAIKEKGLTIVPLNIFKNETNLIKVKIALVKGKKTFDKKQSLKEKDLKRELDKTLKR